MVCACVTALGKSGFMFIEDIARQNKDAPCVRFDARLQDALTVMSRANDGAVFILSAEGRLEGILTDGDVRRAANRGMDLGGTPLSAAMTRNPVAIAAHATVVEAFSTMKRQEISVLPVVDAAGMFLSYVRLHDVAAVLSPERIYPTSLEAGDDENHQKHFARYGFAAGFMLPDFRVLDCACGAGYGARVLAQRAGAVLGVDISEESIAFARLNHALPNIEFRCQGLEELDLPAESLDAVVSLETLEHVDRAACEGYLDNIRRWIKPGGVIVASAPMLRFRDGRPYVTNPYHINELPRAELIEMLRRRLDGFVLHFYHQKIETFLPLTSETEGFCVVVGRKLGA